MKNTAKRIIALLAAAVLAFSALPTAVAANIPALPSAQSFYLNDEPVTMAAYTISGNNYVKLRDICNLLNYALTTEVLTSGEFEGSRVIWINNAASYSAVGDINANASLPTDEAIAIPNEILIQYNTNGTPALPDEEKTEPTPIKSYLIDGNNYIQLREFGSKMFDSVTDFTYGAGRNVGVYNGFDVRYKPADNSVRIYSNTEFNGANIIGSAPLDADDPLYTMVDEILGKIINHNMTEEQRVRAVYDFLINNFLHNPELETLPETGRVEYTRVSGSIPYSITQNEFWAHYLLITGAGVCDDFSATFKVLLNRAGIECEMLGGEYINSDGTRSAHAWNTARVDGVWYYYDVDVEGTTLRRGRTGDYLWYMLTAEQDAKYHDEKPRA